MIPKSFSSQAAIQVAGSLRDSVWAKRGAQSCATGSLGRGLCRGAAGDKPCGFYTYVKSLGNGEFTHAPVSVFSPNMSWLGV
jgi:hypothetical protein